MARQLIGPALPPGFPRRAEAEPGEDFSQVAGPALPPDYKSSCSSETPDSDDDSESLPLPRDTNRDSEEETEDPAPKKPKRTHKDDDDDGFFGPALPPGFKKQDDSPERPIIGPALPPGFRKASEDTRSSRCFIGPSVPSESRPQLTDSSEDEDNLIGPMPAKGPVESDVAKEFERRAQRMKEKLTAADSDEPKQVTRESWMTELPPELKSFGFGPRTFKRRADDKSGDRSIWTDTPADRERKAKEREEAKKSSSKDNEEMVLSGRDKRLIEQVSSYNESKRSESLMDIHQKKLKSKASEEKSKPQERRPFDREQDLKVNRFDEAQKKALIRKSRDLNSKFEHSKGNMFL
ncbi:GPALPP motifs-containing protein 1 [Ammospiza nelsoni]|uniref:GPALPP motifs-containing protein 1 n=1 Tax=Ammospiza caudacuta TaxID=2857398 RepID=UPI0027386AC4|nr:GPALPP motifs-containing protein 1 [Ammospiza caudacuta]XP_059350067.1 GPALPP motifs-containing protein 1 [Ammospiza nelsoni]